MMPLNRLRRMADLLLEAQANNVSGIHYLQGAPLRMEGRFGVVKGRSQICFSRELVDWLSLPEIYCFLSCLAASVVVLHCRAPVDAIICLCNHMYVTPDMPAWWEGTNQHLLALQDLLASP